MDWHPDRVVPGFHCAVMGLPHARKVPGDPDGELTATMVARCSQPQQQRAVLYIHGWSDLFHQAHLAAEVESWGADFHALDLRRYGRNIVAGQRSGWIDDLGEYDEEIDAAMGAILADHDSVTLMGHSTGGLIASLWADRHPHTVDGLILNSPWLDMQGSAITRSMISAASRTMCRADPDAVIRHSERDNFGRSIRRADGGEWDIPELKNPQDAPFKVRAGWLAAIVSGQERVRAGLSIDVPVLCLMSARSDLSTTWNEDMRHVDTVLDVERLASAAVHLGAHVTVVRIDGGLHDLVLSEEPVRAEVFEQMRTWRDAWVTPHSRTRAANHCKKD